MANDNTTGVAVGRVISNQSPTQLATTLGAGNYVTPTRDFAINYNKHTVTGRNGVPIPTDAALKAFLLANAPVV